MGFFYANFDEVNVLINGIKPLLFKVFGFPS